MNILIVEHDPEAAKALRDRITEWNCRATTATTGTMALKLAASCCFDLVLLDIFLPDVLGHTLIPEFKARAPQTQIIVMTSYNTRQLEREARIQGIAYYLIKPFEISHLNTIVKHLDRKKGGAADEGNGSGIADSLD